MCMCMCIHVYVYVYAYVYLYVCMFLCMCVCMCVYVYVYVYVCVCVQGEAVQQLREALKILAERVLILEHMIGIHGEEKNSQTGELLH